MRRDDALVVGDAERVERLGGVPHGRPVRLAPHDDRDGLGHAPLYTAGPKRRRGCIGIHPSQASRYVPLTLSPPCWALGLRWGMSKSLSARAKAGSAPVLPRAQPDERQPVRRDAAARRAPARNVPSELAVLLAEIERLQAALKAEQAQGEGARGERRYRSADAGLQPARLRPRAQALARLCETLLDPRGADLRRSRRLQAGERPAWPCGRRCRADRGRGAC